MIFYSSGGFDSHSDLDETLDERLPLMDHALDAFATEMKAQGIWDKVTVVVCSEFGRTITSNGLGTDHGWGGHAFMLGGEVDGGHVFGSYPTDLSEDAELNVGRGRLIPTTPWEGLWSPVAEWYGASDLEKVLPNLGNFPDDSEKGGWIMRG